MGRAVSSVVLLMLLSGRLVHGAAPAGATPGCARRATRVGYRLSGTELRALVVRAFQPGPRERNFLVLTDVPETRASLSENWKERIALASDWAAKLREGFPDRAVTFAVFVPRGSNNADLPERLWIVPPGHPIPDSAEALRGRRTSSVARVLGEANVVLAPTEFSLTAPLKQLAKEGPYHFRAATLPGFLPEMTRALRLDLDEVHRRCQAIHDALDGAVAADITFETTGDSPGRYELTLDLRHRVAHVSSGILRAPNAVGNLPSGETYIVPYEGEIPGVPSLSQGTLPVEMDGEVVLFRVRGNRIVGVSSHGPRSRAEWEKCRREPAYANLAELGLGVLQSMRVAPSRASDDARGLLNEKLALHLALGRSEHLGGVTGPEAFTSPESVIHIDHVYHPAMQPHVRAVSVRLRLQDGTVRPLLENGQYVRGILPR